MGQGAQLCGGHHAGCGEHHSCGLLSSIPCAALLFDRHGKLVASNARADDLHIGENQSGWVTCQHFRNMCLTCSAFPCKLAAEHLSYLCLLTGIDKSLCTFEKFAPSVEVCGASLSAGEVLQSLLKDTACIQ